MKKATVRKLEIHRETLAQLDVRLLGRLAAGEDVTTNCKKSCLTTSETCW